MPLVLYRGLLAAAAAVVACAPAGAKIITLAEAPIYSPNGAFKLTTFGLYQVRSFTIKLDEAGQVQIGLFTSFLEANQTKTFEFETTLDPNITFPANDPRFYAQGTRFIYAKTEGSRPGVFNGKTGITISNVVVYAVGGAFGLPTGVPEPASWALMISGFGLAGAGLRRHAAKPASPIIAGSRAG